MPVFLSLSRSPFEFLDIPIVIPMIIGEVRRYLRDNNTIRVSRSVRDLAYKALQVKEKLTSASSVEPSIEAIAKELGETVDNDPVYNDGGDSIYIMDQIRDDNNNDEVWLEDIALKEAMKKLSEREKKIIALRFYSGKTQTEIAEEIGISQAQVSRLEKGALDQIKKQL